MIELCHQRIENHNQLTRFILYGKQFIDFKYWLIIKSKKKKIKLTFQYMKKENYLEEILFIQIW